MAGKGDKRRPEDRTAFCANYERAFGHAGPRRGRGGRHMLDVRTRKLRPVDLRTDMDGLREPDSRNIRSVASGIAPEQIPEFEARYGHMGVRYDKETGDAIYADRASKLRVIKARKYHDRDEVRG